MREDGQNQKTNLLLKAVGMEYDDLKVVARVNDLETVKNMVAKGMGIALIPKISAQSEIKGQQLLCFSLSKHLEQDGIYLVYPKDYSAKDRAWNFIDYISVASSHGFLHG